MIAWLRGTLRQNDNDLLILDVHGVGYQVQTSSQTSRGLPKSGVEIALHIHTHVREDQITLFGFATPDERMLFRRLLTVNGVGPRMALAILSGIAPHDLVQTVVSEDTAQLRAIAGVGKKTAERIVLDLRDRLLKDHPQMLHTSSPAGGTTNHDALSALLNLGYTQATAEAALRRATAGKGEQPLGTLLKMALRELAN